LFPELSPKLRSEKIRRRHVVERRWVQATSDRRRRPVVDNPCSDVARFRQLLSVDHNQRPAMCTARWATGRDALTQVVS